MNETFFKYINRKILMFTNERFRKNLVIKCCKRKKHSVIPKQADVVVIGGGSAGCNALYHLSKKGINAILLERHNLTAGTTWHTAGLIWSLRPSDVEIEILSRTKSLLQTLRKDTPMDPGWIQNGGLFIAHSKIRLDEYKRLLTIGKLMNIECSILNPLETKQLFPLLNEKSFMASLYSPEDGVVDPAMLCAALKYAASEKGAKVFENCGVDDIIVTSNNFNELQVKGIKTSYGIIKTDTVINATGVWGQELMKKYGSILPLIPIKHSYVISEAIPNVNGLPNIRDHDYSIYFRIQGSSICMGGYENNPIFIDNVSKQFKFGLYDLDWKVFETHIEKAINLCDSFGKYGIKTTICGPESFTPDHKPLMGPDMKVRGVFHSCGYNSAGMMFGGGCGEQIALWATNGEPELPMFQFDVRRFSKRQISNQRWLRERSHESYVKNYSIVFPNDQPLGGRNICKDPLHDDMIQNNAFMEEKQGYERPGLFLKQNAGVEAYDWYGGYDCKRKSKSTYSLCLERELSYEFSGHHDQIREEALSCRQNAVIFNLSYFGKMILEGPESNIAADWLFTSDVNKTLNKVIYTCALNNSGGVEADVTVTKFRDWKNNECKFYIVSGGASSNYVFHFLNEEINRKGFKAKLRNVTEKLGIISVQGPRSRKILQEILKLDLSTNLLRQNEMITRKLEIQKFSFFVKILRVSFVGELGFEFHVPKSHCSTLYNYILSKGKQFELKNAGYRALYSLSNEKGYHLWGFDLRSSDTPVESNLLFTCKNNTNFKGKKKIEEQKKLGISKKLAFIYLNDDIPLWGLEAVYRNGKPVGFLRRGDYSFVLKKPLGKVYIESKNSQKVDTQYITSGHYQVEVMGKLYAAECSTKSPYLL